MSTVDPYLCFVKGCWAFFTNNPKQWGDDWDDAPYEHNAGWPYKDDGFEVIRVAFDAHYDTPADIAGLNSRYSVQQINSKYVPWLTPSQWGGTGEPIFAGETLEEFARKIEASGGDVYLKRAIARSGE